MNATTWSRRLIWLGLFALALGTLDPLEGSLLILPAVILLAFAAHLGNLPTRRSLVWAAALVTLGVATLFAMSFIGGIGGDTGRSQLWALLLLPYVVGWILALSGGVRSLRAGRLRHASSR